MVVHVCWVARRFRQFRKLDWAYELLVTWLIAVAWWHGIQQGPVWDTELPGSPLWLRGAIALAVVVFSLAVAWLRMRELRRPAGARAG